MSGKLNAIKIWILDSKVSVTLLFLYNYLGILSFSTLKEVFEIGVLVRVIILLLMISMLPNILLVRDKRKVLAMVITFVGVILSQFDGVTNYATITLLIMGLANEDIKPYAKALMYSLVLGFFTVLALRFIGIIPDRMAISPRGVTRYSLGFGSARGISEYYLNFCKLFVFINFSHIKTKKLFLLSIPIIPINLLVDSRATTMLCFLFLFLVFMIKEKNRMKTKLTDILYGLSVSAYFFCFIAIYLGSLLFNPSSQLWTKINSILSGRLLLGKWYLNNFPIKLFGQWIPIDQDLETLLTKYNTNYLMLDSGYMTMLIEGGIIITIIMTVIIIVSFRKMKLKQNNVGLLVWLIAALNLFQTRLLNINSLEVLLLAQAFELNKEQKEDLERRKYKLLKMKKN